MVEMERGKRREEMEVMVDGQNNEMEHQEKHGNDEVRRKQRDGTQ